MKDFSDSIFNSTEEYYRKFRLKLPNEIRNFIISSIDQEIIKQYPNYLDIGTGTGQVLSLLAPHFTKCIGIDSNCKMITLAKEENTFEHVLFNCVSAEDFESNLKFSLVTFGSSLHWMDIGKVFNLLKGKLLSEYGYIAIISSKSIWNTNTQWEQKILEIIKSFLGNKRRAGKSQFTKDERRFEDYLLEYGFDYSKELFEINIQWQVNDYVGHLLSTSFVNKELLGSKVQAFIIKVTETLKEIHKSNIFQQISEYECILARKKEN